MLEGERDEAEEEEGREEEEALRGGFSSGDKEE